MKVLIMAGGTGARLWPLSQGACPKQFISLVGPESLLVDTVRRFSKDRHDIWVCVQQRHAALAKAHLRKVDPSLEKKIIQEPYAKNTAPALLSALKYLRERKMLSDDEIVALVPADHYVERSDLFLRQFEWACQVARQRKIVAFAVAPRRIETGYGYFRLEGEVGVHLYAVNSFIEKPDPIMAKYLIDQGNAFWNAGIYLFQTGHFLALVKKWMPLFDAFMRGEQTFDALPALSIDRALIEKTEDLLVLQLQTGWSDLGTWESLCEVLPKKEKNFEWGKIETFPTIAALSSEKVTLYPHKKCWLEIFSKECWTPLEGAVLFCGRPLEIEGQMQFDKAATGYIENPFSAPAVWMRHRFSGESSKADKNQ